MRTFRILHLIGCLHGCGEKPVWASGEYLRSQCASIFSRLQWFHQKSNRSSFNYLSFGIFHSYLGFCTELSNPFSPGLAYTRNRIPIIICFSLFFNFAENTKKSKGGPDLSPHGYSNNFGETGGVGTKEGVQHDIINVTFNNFVTF